MCSSRCGVAALLCVSLCGCAVIPDVPPDFALPIRDILVNSSCELKAAFLALADPAALDAATFKRFKPQQWLITLSLTPRVDTDFAPGIGGTRKTLASTTKFATWAISAPGIQLDDKATRTGGVAYTYKSKDLMSDTTLDCHNQSPTLIALTLELGVKQWLLRTASAMRVSRSVNIDKPSFNSEFTIKLGGNGSWTYTFAPGTDLLSLAASYSLDVQFNIGMVPLADKKQLHLVSLPAGQDLTNGNAPEQRPLVSSTTLDAAQYRLDTLQLEQAIRNIQQR
jgi:hypothetical protein